VTIPCSHAARAATSIALLTLTGCIRHGTSLPVCTLETDPWPGATSVPLDATPTVTLPGFASAPDSLDGFAQLVVLRDLGTLAALDVATDVSWTGHPEDALRIVLTPVAPFQASHRYRLETLEDAASSTAAGVELPAEYFSSVAEFTTSTDPMALAVKSAANVAHTGGDDADLTVLFSEAMDLATVADAIVLHVAGRAEPLAPQHVGASNAWERAVDIVVPDSVAVDSVTVTTAAVGASGRPLAADRELSMPELGVQPTSASPWVRAPSCVWPFGL
jgi:hypothetical protein